MYGAWAMLIVVPLMKNWFPSLVKNLEPLIVSADVAAYAWLAIASIRPEVAARPYMLVKVDSGNSMYMQIQCCATR